MASIFKRSIVKQKVENLKIVEFDKKLAVVQNWYKAYQDGTLQLKTEGQCEQAFNDDIFKKILGYTEYPTQPHTLIPQLSPDKGGQRADTALGWFDGKKQRVFAVVEIKDVNKPLDRSQQREGNLTPIQQAFKYKPLFKDCRFVIATNFYEIRLFQDNQLDYEIFTLKSLVDPSNDYFELKKFILLLSAENFVSGRGKSKTEELIAEIRIEQEQITKAFYSEYSQLRLDLMRDIWKQNKDKRNIHLITDKAQKILDRIVFISFCEDTGLLPDNTLHKVFTLVDSSSNFASVWDTLKGFFTAIDSGSEKLGIPNGYNGGLFHADKELDELEISDEVLKSLGSLSRYDFENELTVNVLGHVFEQSIADLEEIKQKVSPDEASIKSKRKKEGIFYTPEYIVDYIVQNSLGIYLKENQERIFEEHKLSQAKTEKSYRDRELKALTDYQVFLHDVKIVDPACGSGAFLVKVFDYLLQENNRVNNAKADLVGKMSGQQFELTEQEDVIKDILRNNIYGVDLNEESVRITQLSLWLKTAQRGKKLTYLDKNIRVGNSLINESNVAGSKAFIWEMEFKDIFENGGFSVVVGNPPYIRIQNFISSEKEELYYKNNYTSAVGKYDAYVLFIEKGYELLNKNGFASYILPHKFLNTDYGRGIRKFISEKRCVSKIVDFGTHQIFGDATTYTCVIFITKSDNTQLEFSITNPEQIENSTELKKSIIDYKSLNSGSWNLISSDEQKLLDKIKKNNLNLKGLVKGIYQGIVTTGDDIFIMDGFVKNNYFHGYSNALKKTIKIESAIMMPVAKGKDIRRYKNLVARLYTIYPHEIINGKTVAISEDKFKDIYPLAYNYISQFKNELIEKKNKYKTNPSLWYSLHRSRDLTIFKEAKIITPQLQNYPNFTLNTNAMLTDAGGYIIPIPLNTNYNSQALLSLLNSRLMWFFIKMTSNLFNSGYYYFKTKYLEPFPIAKISKEDSDYLKKMVDMIFELNSKSSAESKKFSEILNSKYEISLNLNQETIIKLNWESFLAEFKKRNITLDINEHDKLNTWFKEKKQFFIDISQEIDNLNHQIDQIIYRLYDLSIDEISIVEKSYP